MPKAVNTDDLKNAAVTYDPILRELPYFVLNEIAKKLRINIIEVNGEHVLVNKRRKAGLIRPYTPGLPLGNQQEIMKFFEAKLKPEKTYAELTDNVTNYDDVKIISAQGNFSDNKTKEHPLKLIILKDTVISYSEDVAFNMWFAERDEAVASATTAFTGFFPRMDLLLAAGEISAAKDNLRNTGAIVAATGYDQLVEFIATSNPLLRQANPILYTSEAPLDNALIQYADKVKSHTDPTIEDMIKKLRSDAKCPNLQVVTDPVLGSGDRLTLMLPGLLDLGVNKNADGQFVQVRTPYKDPNDVQFWIQASYDTRIRDIHPKLFRMNEQKNTSVNYAGDYQ